MGGWVVVVVVVTKRVSYSAVLAELVNPQFRT